MAVERKLLREDRQLMLALWAFDWLYVLQASDVITYDLNKPGNNTLSGAVYQNKKHTQLVGFAVTAVIMQRNSWWDMPSCRSCLGNVPLASSGTRSKPSNKKVSWLSLRPPGMSVPESHPCKQYSSSRGLFNDVFSSCISHTGSMMWNKEVWPTVASRMSERDSRLLWRSDACSRYTGWYHNTGRSWGCGLQGCDSIQFGRYVATFRKNLLTTLKKETADLSEMSVPMKSHPRRH